MAALANIYTKVMEKHPKANCDLRGAGSPAMAVPYGAEAGRNPRAAATAGAFPALAPLRVFANEDIYFYVKRIDNFGVVRAVDPGAARGQHLVGVVVGVRRRVLCQASRTRGDSEVVLSARFALTGS